MILPAFRTPLGALPSRFRRERWLIVGCGDVGTRIAVQMAGRVRMLALTSSPQRVPELQTLGIQALVGNLDTSASLRRLAGVAHRVLHLAPPPSDGTSDPRTTNLCNALRQRSAPRTLVYASTSGVYGDCAGEWVDETRALLPKTARAQRRLSAEQSVRAWGLGTGVCISVLRIPGIYAPDREGGTPMHRLQRGTPVLCAADDVYTNHIHADDLAHAFVLAALRATSQRTYNINDDTVLKMGDYMDMAADVYALPHPPRVTRAQAQEQLSPMLLSFMSESRRLQNRRMKVELRLRLRYPWVGDGLRA